jgi:hypothetical protein
MAEVEDPRHWQADVSPGDLTPHGQDEEEVHMATTAAVMHRGLVLPRQGWLHSPTWDLSFLIFSVVVAFVPYSVYVIFGGEAFQTAGVKGTRAYDARVFVNTLVAVLVGGPHMYATFTRTIMDREFLRKRFLFVASSILVPIVVVTMAVASYESYVWLLSIFFSMASVHALHQLVWVTEAYNKKAGFPTSLLARGIDYGVVLSSLYPIAVWKMVEGKFTIGPVVLKYNEIIAGWWWLAYLAFAGFFVMLLAFIGKTVIEARAGQFNLPKTLLISITVSLMFWTPAFPNMDTAFQGINTWHSFQYLALTWYANRLREERTRKRIGFLHAVEDMWQRATRSASQTENGVAGSTRRLWVDILGGLRRIDGNTGWSTFYMLCLAMLPISGLLIIAAGVLWPHLHGDLPGADEAYTYMGILSILLVHYVHDALLFTDHDAIVK